MLTTSKGTHIVPSAPIIATTASSTSTVAEAGRAVPAAFAAAFAVDPAVEAAAPPDAGGGVTSALYDTSAAHSNAAPAIVGWLVASTSATSKLAGGDATSNVTATLPAVTPRTRIVDASTPRAAAMSVANAISKAARSGEPSGIDAIS